MRIARPPWILLALFAFLAGTLSASVLVLKDGSRVTADLKVCDEEECTAGGRRIPLALIARIELANNSPIPPAATAGSIVLTDGTIRRGSFTGLNAGYVWLGDEEIDRELVAVIVLSSGSLTAPLMITPKDVLIGTSGEMRSGSITSCSAASCVFDGETVPLDGTRWIGLKQEGKLPPVSGSGESFIVLEDQRVGARLFSLDADTARTTRGTFPRRAIHWIHIAPAASASDDPGQGGTAQPPPGPEPNVPVPPPPPPPAPATVPQQPQPPSAPAPAPVPASATPGGGPETRGGLWIGTIVGRLFGTDGRGSIDLMAMVAARLREYTLPMMSLSGNRMKTVGTVSYLRSERSVIRNTYVMQGPGVYCSGEGHMVATWSPEAAMPSVILDKRSPGETASLYGVEVPTGKALYWAGVPAVTEQVPEREQEYEVVCRPGGAYRMGYFPLMAGRPPIGPNRGIEDPEYRYADGGKLIGGYTIPNVWWQLPVTGSDFPLTLTVSWAICREGVQCPQPQPVGEGSSQAPRRDPRDKPDCTRLQSLRNLMRELSDLSQQYHNALNEANRQRAAASDAIWGANGSLAKYFTSMLKLASQGLQKSAQALKDAIGYSTTLMGMSGEGTIGDVNKAVKQMGYGPQDLLLSAAEKQGVKAAVERANTYLAQTGDHQGALRAYSGSVERSDALRGTAKKITGKIGLATALNDYARKTNSLFDSFDSWLDAFDAQQRAEADIADVQRRIAEALEEIQRLQDELGDDCPPGSAHLHAPATPYLFARLPLGAGPESANEDSFDSASAQKVAAELQKQEQNLARVAPLFEAATPWLLPFALDLTDDMDRTLLAAFLQQASPHLAEIDRILEESRATGVSIGQTLEDMKPEGGRTGASGAGS